MSILALLLACTTFCTSGLFGRNYDFEIGEGMVLVNTRGLAKKSQLENGAKWTSRHGSVTFNQFGRESPTGGMNEKGLVVELMWLDGTRYPASDARPELGTLEWIQYQLDTAATVAEVIENAKKVRITQRGTPLHYLVADASGDVAAIEFLEGSLVVHRGATALANDPYEQSLAALRRGSTDRFARASKGATTIDGAFALLDEVAQIHTRWSIVYDIRARSIAYRTAVNRARRDVRLTSFDFSCQSPARMLDVDAGRGDVTKLFREYSTSENDALVKRAYRGTSFLRDAPLPASLPTPRCAR